MNVSISWLKKYVDTNLSTNEICDILTMTGTKVETIQKFGKKTNNVVVGKVVEVKTHLEDDKLRIVTVDVNSGKNLVAVAKIADITVGDLIPVALVGSTIEGKGEIKESIVSGVKSECMVCHIQDFGLTIKELPFVKESGLIAFPNDVAVGSDVNKILGLGDDIIEFEITPNRPDCLSVEGIARELAASLNKELKLVTNNNSIGIISKDLNGVTVKVETSNCTRYMLKRVSNITIKDSPIWMQMQLIKCGVRPINNIVDITNYVMIELGQPLHAFDADKITGNTVIVRQAKEGEKLLTLDGVERNLSENNMCICDAEKPIAIAGVMGGELSGINENTTNVLFEAATFVRGSIRKTSKEQQIRTEASSRYEKGLPEELAPVVLSRVCNLIDELGIGTIIDTTIDVYENMQKVTKIKIDYEYINKFIGIKLSDKDMNEIFEMLDIKVENGIANIPYFRQDIEIMADLAEEVARIYGYENIPSTKVLGTETTGKKTEKQMLEEKVKDVMIAEGYNEIYTYTFFNKDSLDKLYIPEDDNIRKGIIEIINPLSSDFTYLRTSMLPVMIEALDRNYSKKNLDIKLFELSKIFVNNGSIGKGELPNEELVLTVGMYGKHDFFELKGVIENLVSRLNISEYELVRCNDLVTYHPGQSAKMVIGNDTIGIFGKISPKVAKNFNIPEDTYIAEIYFDMLVKYSKNNIKFTELPKYPAVERDIAFTVTEDVLSGDAIKCMKEVSKKIESIELFDIYKGAQIENGYKSMAYSIFIRDKEKTLNEEEITDIMNKIVSRLEEKFNAKIRK